MAASELLPLKSYDTFDHSISKRGASPHPQDAAGCLSRLLLDWVKPLMALGQRKQLDADDVWPLRWELQANTASYHFSSVFEASQSMYKAAAVCFGRRIVLTGAAFLVSMLCNLLGPVVLRQVVSSLSALAEEDPEDETPALQSICLWVVALFAAKVLQALTDNYGRFYSEVIAIKLVASVKTLMFRKTLRLNAEARRDKSTGAITNMYTSDSDAILDTAFLIHQLWLIPLQIAIVSYMLYDVLGVAALAGVSVIVVMLGINHLISRCMFSVQRVYRRSKDVRMKKVTEVFKAVEIVKFNAWEDRLLGQIKQARATEMKVLFKRRLLACLSVVMLWGMPVFISVASFGVYTGVMHRSLTPSIVFTSIALFQLIQGPLRMITNILPMLVQSKVALERIAAFLEMPELEDDNVMTADHPLSEKYVIKKVIVAVKDGEFGWDHETTLLRNVNLEVRDGDFLVLHGPNEIFQKCMLGLLRNKTVILVTHNPEIIESPRISRAVTIDDLGALVETHHVDNPIESEALVSPFAAHSYGSVTFESSCIDGEGENDHGNNESDVLLGKEECTDDESDRGNIVDLAEETSECDNEMALISPCAPCPGAKPRVFSSAAIDHTTELEKLGKLVDEEERVEGHVGSHVFNAYYRAVGGFPIVFLFLMTSACWQALQISSDFWLGAWSSDGINSGESTSYRLTIYTVLGLASALMVFARMFMTAIYGLRAARRMFDAMTNALMHAPMRFFDANPIGRILTRYGSDVSVVDANIPPLFSRMSSTIFSVGCSAATAAIVIRWKGFLLLPVAYLYYRIGSFYIRPARELQRLSKTTQAPVLNHLSEAVDGGAVIRAYGQGHVNRFQVTNSARLDDNNKICLLVLVVTASLVLLRHQLDAAVIGLAFSYALKGSGHFFDLMAEGGYLDRFQEQNAIEAANTQ
ncbi:hypothetical protein KRP22_011858 [Phytophthora ramorum]|nr:ABC transporter C family member 9 [Phytophthora ramorum]